MKHINQGFIRNLLSHLLALVWSRVGHLFSDKLYLKVRFFLLMGKKLNLENPQTYNEKLQWLKLYDRNPDYTKMVDKYAVKEYVASIIGPEYVIPTIGVWDSPEIIEWSRLPNQFVLKTTNGGGGEGVVICKDINKFDKKAAIRILKRDIKSDWRIGMEWPYKNVTHRIIAEERITPSSGINDLYDYKFFCFNGKVKALFVASDRQSMNEEVKFDFYDADFNHLPFKQGHSNARIEPVKPRHFELMKKLAEQLSKGMCHVRVDMYDLGDKVLFGELTFFHFSGTIPFVPEEWDNIFGDWLTLKKSNS